jgi:hypothetical protein
MSTTLEFIAADRAGKASKKLAPLLAEGLVCGTLDQAGFTFLTHICVPSSIVAPGKGARTLCNRLFLAPRYREVGADLDACTCRQCAQVLLRDTRSGAIAASRGTP